MKFELTEKHMDEISADFEAIFIVGENLKHKFIKDADQFDFYNYKGDGVLVLPQNRRIYVGIKALKYDAVRLGAAKIWNALKSYKIKSLKIGAYICGCQKLSFSALVEGFVLGAYEFDKYKSVKNSTTLDEIYFCADEYNERELKFAKIRDGIKEAQILADFTNFAKDCVNEIPEIYTPIKMADDARKLADEIPNLECEIYDENFLREQNMNAFLAVNRSSALPPRLIHLRYKPQQNALKKIALVGKGLTYDSGGLSLKPSDYMLTMKSDKSGAISAMSIIATAAKLNLPFEIHAVLGASENMIGGNSYKPDDVLISRSGVTIEVRNTDAEGRLVLADCLSYAQDLNPDLIIDFATLTGACVVGLGEFTSAIMGNNEDLKREFKELSAPSGELFTILEFNDYLRDLIKSNIADVSNTASSRYGGSITAGLFLDKFIKEDFKDKWLHLDIAGPAYLEKAWGYNQIGATGAAIRAVIYYLKALAKPSCGCDKKGA